MTSEIIDKFKNKSIAIAGFGVEGKAAYSLLQKIECDVTVIDQDSSAEVPTGVKSQLGDEWLDNIVQFDIVLRTSGMNPDKLTGANDVLTSIELLLSIYGHQTIAVTGTKGKTTTVKLTRDLLEAAGVNVELVGNVGRSAWEIIQTGVTEDTAIVAELSSFQLSDVTHSPHIAGLLPITADHLDWHPTMDDYVSSKLNIVRFQSELDTTIADRATLHKLNVVEETTANVKPTDEFIIQDSVTLQTSAGEIAISQLQLKGQHNVDNIKLAFSLTAEWLHKHGLTINEVWSELSRTIIEFKPLDYHLQRLGGINGVEIINDSYASNPTATLAAIKSTSGPITLILGGHTKDLDLSPLLTELDYHLVNNIVVIGADKNHCQNLADQIANQSRARVDIVGEQNMDTILSRAMQLSDPRTTILFSPAHASFDMYKNFNERGRLFTESVEKLRSTA